MSAYNFVHSGPNFAKFFLFNTQKIDFVNAVYILSLSASIPEIFALKLEIVVNCNDFCTFFALPNFKGAVPPKVVLALTPPPGDTSSAKVSSGYTP